MNRQILPTTEKHILELSITMRKQDKEEVWAAGHKTPYESLALSVKASDEPFTGLLDGEVVCIFGVADVTFMSDKGVPWMMTSDLIKKTARVFLYVSNVYTQEILKRYNVLENYVDVRNTVAVKWLKWLGFEFDEEAPYGAEQLPFMRFEMRK